jgi:hypothetical protein
LFVHAQAKAAEGEEDPVKVVEGDEEEADGPAGGGVVTADFGEFAVQQAQPNQGEEAAGDEMQEDHRHDGEAG